MRHPNDNTTGDRSQENLMPSADETLQSEPSDTFAGSTGSSPFVDDVDTFVESGNEKTRGKAEEATQEE